MKQPATSSDIYDVLKGLMPGLPDSTSIRSLKIILGAGEPAVVELETYVLGHHVTSTKRFNLTERPA